MNSLNDVWQGVLDVLSKDLTQTTITTWFGGCTPVEITDRCLVLYTEKPFHRNIIAQRFAKNISAALYELFSCEFEVRVLTGDELDDYNAEKAVQNAPENVPPDMVGYTFDNFIVGKSNTFAHAAAIAVSKKPGSTYNPLFIYGNSGLGKTHLLLAIAHYIHEQSPEKSIAYVKGDDFTVQLVTSIREGSMDEFRAKYRKVDLFLVDDIQFISGKVQTQVEFFNTFNAIYEAGHQIVITSDRPPREMATLEDRLVSRFEGGLMADIQPPDIDTRMAIIRNKAALLGLVISDEAVELIAKSITSNVRQLEGVIKKLTAYKEILNDDTNIDAVQRAIADVKKNGTYVPTPERIISETARYYSIKEEDIRGHGRAKNTVTARQISMYLIRQLIGTTLQDIGSYYGDKNHATVLSSIRKIESLINSDATIASTVRDITSNVSTE